MDIILELQNMTMKRLTSIILLFYLFNFAQAGEADGPVQWLGVGLDNDVVFQTDKYYTNGLHLEFYTRRQGFPLINLFHLKNNINENSYYGFSISQDIFTPEEKNSIKMQIGDRPFASSLLISSSKTIVNDQKKMIRKSELQIGVLGKYSGGEFVQNGVHNLLPTSSVVDGWENQIKTTPALNYGLKYEKWLTGNHYVHLSGELDGKIGLPYTYAGTGLNVRVGAVDKYFKQLNFFSTEKVTSFFYSGIKGRFVAYNATLQREILSGSNANYPKINNFLYELDAGINVSYRSMKLNLGFKHYLPGN